MTKEEEYTVWEPPAEEEEAEDKATATEKPERKGSKKAKEPRQAEPETEEASPGPPERRAVWVCKECGMSWPRPRLSCNFCGGPTGRFFGTTEELSQYAKRVKTRRGRGIINS